MEIRKAQRKQAKIKLALQGPSGSGKTMSALLLASGLTSYSKIAVIDTENHSADLYAHLGDYNVLQLSQPFSPERYIKAIETCEQAKMEVIIIDSISHEWEGVGGILDVHGAMPGNSFTNWNKVCTNLCISTDGFKSDVKVRTIAELAKEAYNLFGEFNVYREVEAMNNLPGTTITESQFVQIVGRARLYQNMPYKDRKDLPQFPLLDSQVNLVVKDYYSDESFCRDPHGDINLWKLYNLFTGANKSSYIDNFPDRSVGCQQFVNGLHEAIGMSKHHWFVS